MTQSVFRCGPSSENSEIFSTSVLMGILMGIGGKLLISISSRETCYYSKMRLTLLVGFQAKCFSWRHFRKGREETENEPHGIEVA